MSRSCATHGPRTTGMFAHEEGDTQTTLYLLFKRTGTDQPAQVFSGSSFVLAAIHDMRPFRHTSPPPPPLSLWQCPGGFYCVRSLVMADTLFACSCSILLPDWPFKYVSNVCFSGTSAFNNIEIYLHGLKYFVLVGHNIRLENGCCTWNSPTSIWGRQVMRWLRFVIIILYLKLKDYSVWRGGGS